MTEHVWLRAVPSFVLNVMEMYNISLKTSQKSRDHDENWNCFSSFLPGEFECSVLHTTNVLTASFKFSGDPESSWPVRTNIVSIV